MSGDASKPSSSSSFSTTPASKQPSKIFHSFLVKGFNTVPTSPSHPSQSRYGPEMDIENKLMLKNVDEQIQILVEEVKKTIQPLERRIVAVRYLADMIKKHAVSGIMEVWFSCRSLLSSSSYDARKETYWLMIECIRSLQPEMQSVDRMLFFKTIQEDQIPQDLPMRVASLAILTDDGRNIAPFELQLVELLQLWTRTCHSNVVLARRNLQQNNAALTSVNPSPQSAEHTLNLYLALLTSILKFNFYCFSEEQVVALLGGVVIICKETLSVNDILLCLSIFEVVTRYAYIPAGALEAVLPVLCLLPVKIESLAERTWHVLKNLLLSHVANSTLFGLQLMLRNPLTESRSALRGGIKHVERILLQRGEEEGTEGFPPLSISSALDTLKGVISASLPPVDCQVLIFLDKFLSLERFAQTLSYSDWDVIFTILSNTAQTLHRFLPVDFQPSGYFHRISNVDTWKSGPDIEADPVRVKLLGYASIIPKLQSLTRSTGFTGSLSKYITFLCQVHHILPHLCDSPILEYYKDSHVCLPSADLWLDNCQFVTEFFLLPQEKARQTRLSALNLVHIVLGVVVGDGGENEDARLFFERILSPILRSLQDERDEVLCKKIIRLGVEVAAVENEVWADAVSVILRSCATENSSSLAEPYRRSLESTRSSRRDSGSSGLLGEDDDFEEMSNANINLEATKGLVVLFIRSLEKDRPAMTVTLFKELVRIGTGLDADTQMRMEALDVLLRLRSDSAYGVYVAENAKHRRKSWGSSGIPFISCNVKSDTEVTGNEAERSRDMSVSTSASQDRRGESSSSSRAASIGSPALSPVINSGQPSVTTAFPIGPESASIAMNRSTILSGRTSLKVYNEPKDEEDEKKDEVTRPTTPPPLLPVSLWLDGIISLLRMERNWDIYLCIINNFSHQLVNQHFFTAAIPQIQRLRETLCKQLIDGTFPNIESLQTAKKLEATISLVRMTTILVSYHKSFYKAQEDEIVSAFHHVLQRWPKAAMYCIHAFSICCYELPLSLSKFLTGLMVKLSQLITSPSNSVHILEFLCLVAKVPKVHSNFTEEDFRRVFQVSLQYLRHSRHARMEASVSSAQFDTSALAQYVHTLAYEALSMWFLSLKLSERKKYVPWIVRGLLIGNENAPLDESSLTFLDLLTRFTYSDKPITITRAKLGEETAVGGVKHWLYGNSIMSIQVVKKNGLSKITVRKPSSTLSFFFEPENASNISQDSHEQGGSIGMGNLSAESLNAFPNHILLQISPPISEIDPIPFHPISLPDDDPTHRAISSFDYIPVVNFHKIAIIYVGPDQTTEYDILANEIGSRDYLNFLDGLGKLVRLKDNVDIYTGGLDTANDADGEYTYFWSDKTTHITFHIPTFMPTDLVRDPTCTLKKRHIGNDFVSIIFSDSSDEYDIDTIPSQFNCNNIVISRHSPPFSTGIDSGTTGFWKVQLLQRPDQPEISPIQDTKIISAASLPAFVRSLALNLDIFSNIYHRGRTAGDEYVSNWAARLREINRLRGRQKENRLSDMSLSSGKGGGILSPLQQVTTPGASAGSGRKSIVVETGVGGEEESLGLELDKYDFSRYT